MERLVPLSIRNSRDPKYQFQILSDLRVLLGAFNFYR